MENNAAETTRKAWSVGVMVRRSGLGSARVSRAGERVVAIAGFFCDFSIPSLHETSRKDCFGATPKPARGTRALPLSVSSLLLHHQNERTYECGGQEDPHALQRPNIAGHQCLPDLLDCERANVR